MHDHRSGGGRLSSSSTKTSSRAPTRRSTASTRHVHHGQAEPHPRRTEATPCDAMPAALPRTVAVIGASTDRRKFGNKGVRAFVQGRAGGCSRSTRTSPRSRGYPPVGSVKPRSPDPLDVVSLYVPAAVEPEAVAGHRGEGSRRTLDQSRRGKRRTLIAEGEAAGTARGGDVLDPPRGLPAGGFFLSNSLAGGLVSRASMDDPSVAAACRACNDCRPDTSRPLIPEEILCRTVSPDFDPAGPALSSAARSSWSRSAGCSRSAFYFVCVPVGASSGDYSLSTLAVLGQPDHSWIEVLSSALDDRSMLC